MKEKRNLLSVELPDSMYEELTHYAQIGHCSKGNIIRWALFDYLEMLKVLGGDSRVVRPFTEAPERLPLAILPMEYYVTEDDCNAP